ncbi:hypothetical protein AoKodu_20500 [Actinomyces oris K20]|nr:hypothetical protein AoKodu_20500 [Actinomyces oris K20]
MLATAQTVRTWSQRRGPEAAPCVENEGRAWREVEDAEDAEDSETGGVTAPTLRSGPGRGEDERHAGSLGV